MNGVCFKGTDIVALLIMTFIVSRAVFGNEGARSRPASCAGTWYPGNAGELTKLVDNLMEKASPPEVVGKPRAVIVPHAGYRYSAPVAAAAFKCLRGHNYKRVFALAFSHRYAGAYRGIDVPGEWTAYQTPLGEVPIDLETVKKLTAAGVFSAHQGVDAEEHSLELQLPFLQRAIKSFQLVPLLVGRMSAMDYAAAAKAIVPLLDDDSLLLVSTDCTHFGPNYDYEPFKEDIPKKLKELAEGAASAINACDFDGFLQHLENTKDTICGRGPVLLLLRILSMQGGAKGVTMAYDTSGRMTSDYTNSVTYQSFAFVQRPGTLSEEERKILLRLARDTVTAVLNKKDLPSPKVDTLPEALRKDGACFVTLQNHGDLRGCIGNMEATGPLFEAVIHNAVSAATEDYRFSNNPVTAKELDKIDIEISYLTPMKKVEKVEDIIVGRHGVLVSSGSRRGVFLPQVAYERGWSREQFLTELCANKAGLAPDAWKRPETKLYSFEAEVFGELELGLKPQSAPSSK